MKRTSRDRLVRIVSVLSGLAGLGYVVLTLVTSADDLDGALLPSAGVAGAAFGLHVAALAAGASGFAAIAGRRWSPTIFRGYATSQLAKYLPGGVWQPASQISTVARGGTTVRRSASEYFAGLAVFFVAGATVSSATAFVIDPPLPTGWRLLAAAGLVSPVLLLPPVLRRLAERAPRVRGRQITAEDLPPTDAVVWSFGSFLVAVLLDAVAYAILLTDLEPGVSGVGAGAAFASAWLVGMIAVPVPSGIGVREAVLLAVITDTGTAATILAASLSLRLLSMLAEVAFAGATVLGARPEAPVQGTAVGEGQRGRL